MKAFFASAKKTRFLRPLKFEHNQVIGCPAQTLLAFSSYLVLIGW
jgi:hypothetical protein